jgi:CheY-like chemotaxis protein
MVKSLKSFQDLGNPGEGAVLFTAPGQINPFPVAQSKLFNEIAYSPFSAIMTILNVDDDLEDIEIFCDAVREIDPTIVCLVANSAEEALQLLNSGIELPAYIFLDINMPKVDGNTCLREIKKNRRLSHIPVIMYSTYTRKSDIEMYRQLNALFLTKQNSYHELVHELRNVLARPNASR